MRPLQIPHFRVKPVQLLSFSGLDQRFLSVFQRIWKNGPHLFRPGRCLLPYRLWIDQVLPILEVARTLACMPAGLMMAP